MKHNILKTTVLLLTIISLAQFASAKAPDMETIRFETQNPQSPNYFPKLRETFLSKNKALLKEQYPYFYYGTLFQKEYDPYRENPHQQIIDETKPLYSRHGNLTMSETEKILSTAKTILADNPLDLEQLSHMIYACEQLGKINTANLWKEKLDNIMLTISESGSGADQENAIVIVDPAHEFDFFTISGVKVEKQEFVEPYYEVVTVRMPGEKQTRQYWFNILYILQEYYARHPEEL